LITTLQQAGLKAHELVVQLSNTQSRFKKIPPHVRANNWKLDLDSLAESPECQGRSKTRPLGRRESRPLQRWERPWFEGFTGAAGA
jgi:hypothetical protein